MYTSPTPDMLRNFMKEHSLSGSRVASLCSVNSRIVRRWLAPKDLDGSKDMPGSLWALLRLLMKENTPEEVLEELNDLDS